MAAPPASAIPDRSTTPSPRPSRTTSWSPSACCRATAISRAASIRTCAPTTWRARRWWSPTRCSARWRPTSPARRSAPSQRRQAGLSCATSGRPTPRCSRSCRPICRARAVPGALRRGVQGPGAVARDPGRDRQPRPIAWRDGSTYVKNPPYFEDMPVEPAAARRHRRRARAGGAGRQHHHRPHLARRQHPQDLARRRVSCWSTRSARPTSTATARGAATTT